MYSRFSARRSPAALRRKVLGLLTVLWLNMAVLPCAMAFESSEPCPHCPPAAEHEMPSHRGHVDAEHEMPSHHGHGDADARPSCATKQAECCDLAEASVNSRGSNPEFKPASDVVIITAPTFARVPTSTTVLAGHACDPPDIAGSSPPLHVLFCSYLK